jgi:hypothetical protein
MEPEELHFSHLLLAKIVNNLRLEISIYKNLSLNC